MRYFLGKLLGNSDISQWNDAPFSRGAGPRNLDGRREKKRGKNSSSSSSDGKSDHVRRLWLSLHSVGGDKGP